MLNLKYDISCLQSPSAPTNGKPVNLKPSSKGFTLIELLVVIAIMVLLSSTLIINLAGQRVSRDIRIAQNQLVSDIRKVQSYTLSARSLPSSESVQYYFLKFDLTKPTQYTIQAISNVGVQPKLQDVETVKLPPNIQLDLINPPLITQRPNPASQTPFYNCPLIAFAAPFGKIIFNDGCAPLNYSSPYTLQITDDYYAKIINFLTNLTCDGNNGQPPNPAGCSASTDSLMTITLTDKARSVSRKILINSITGSVCPTQDGLTCLTSS